MKHLTRNTPNGAWLSERAVPGQLRVYLEPTMRLTQSRPLAPAARGSPRDRQQPLDPLELPVMKTSTFRNWRPRRPMLVVYALLLIAITVLVGAFALNWLSSTKDDRLAVISNFLTLGTLLLALVAGIVALVAYAAATGQPDLTVQFMLPGGGFNKIWFPGPGLSGSATALTVNVRNSSKYSARTPAVVIQFRDCYLNRGQFPSAHEWIPTAYNGMGGIVEVQWDGGPNYAIHGDMTRHLPEIWLQGLTRPGESGEMVFRLLADGYSRRPIVKPVAIGSEASQIEEKEWL